MDIRLGYQHFDQRADCLERSIHRCEYNCEKIPGDVLFRDHLVILSCLLTIHVVLYYQSQYIHVSDFRGVLVLSLLFPVHFYYNIFQLFLLC